MFFNKQLCKIFFLPLPIFKLASVHKGWEYLFKLASLLHTAKKTHSIRLSVITSELSLASLTVMKFLLSLSVFLLSRIMLPNPLVKLNAKS